MKAALCEINVPVKVDSFSAGCHFALSEPVVQADLLTGIVRTDRGNIDERSIMGQVLTDDLPVLRQMFAKLLEACVAELHARKKQPVR